MMVRRGEAYVRLQSSHPVMTWFKVIDDSGLVSQSRPAYLFGALFGALALLMVYNLLRFAYTVSYNAYLAQPAAWARCSLAPWRTWASWRSGCRD